MNARIDSPRVMDAKKSTHQPATRAAANGYEQVLPLIAKPAAWASSSTTDKEGNVLWPIPSSAAQSNNQDAGKQTVSKPRKPRKANINNNASAGRSTLFWVHTDPQSVSEGTRAATLKGIRSHVMSEHNRKKRLENTKRYKSKTRKHLALQPVQTTPAEPSSHNSPVNSSSPTSQQSSSPERDADDLIAGSTSPVRHNELVKNATSFPACPAAAGSAGSCSVAASSPDQPFSTSMPTPWIHLAGGANDPFNMTHTPLSDRMLRHLQHFLVDLTRLAYPLQNRSGPKLQRHWASLVQRDPASLHACMCVAASNTALRNGDFPLVDSSKRRSSLVVLDAFHHRGETIRLVNEGLSDPVKAASDELIAAVSVLLTIEIASGNADYLKIHLAGLRQMVALRSSFADVPPDIRFQISWTDIRVACMSFTKPIFPFVRNPRPSQCPLVAPNEDLAIAASRIISLIQIPGIFGNAMSKIIYDLLQLTWYAEWIKGGSGYHMFDEQTEDYFNTEVLYVEYSLHTDRYTESGEVKGDATIEGCVRLACLLYHNSAIWDFYPQIAPVFPKPIIALRMALEATIPAGYYNLCRDLLIWVLFIGACSSRLPFERSFFVTELAAAVRIQDIRSWQELRALLMCFFYVDRSYLTPLRTLWDEIRIQQ